MLSTVQKIGPALDLFTVKRPEWGISEVAEALDTPKSSAHALLTTMADIGLLERTARARYRLGWRLLVLGSTLMLSTEARAPVGRALRRTVDRWGETMHFAVYERGCVVYVEKVEGRHSIPVPTRLGVRLPAHASAVGKALLAARPEEELDQLLAKDRLKRYTERTLADPALLRDELERVRADGVAFDDEEAVRGVRCVGVPIRSRQGVVVGAISLSASSTRFERRRDAYADLVHDLGARLSRELGAPDEAAPRRRLASAA